MKTRVMGLFLCILCSVLLYFSSIVSTVDSEPLGVYQVYLNGEKIGLIESKDDLLELIDTEQAELRKAYGVDKVYPPSGLDIEKIYTYNDEIVNTETIYNRIKDSEPFTIEGYVAKIIYTEDKVINDDKIVHAGEPVYINMLDKDILETSLYNTAAAFIGTEDLKKFEDGLQEEITETGSKITSVYFQETITVKKDLVSTKDYIFKDVDELSKYLLYGTLEDQEKYTTKDGENLDAIADAHSLNIEELMIANPQYSTPNVLLSAGEQINIGLISPIINIVYRKTVVEDVEVSYKTEKVKDNTKYTSYKQTTQNGSNGITRITQDIKYINGEIQNLNIVQRDVLVPPVNEIITVGTKTYGGGSYEGFVSTEGNDNWSWPTISPFVITSRYKWRWGRQHQGIDISGTGHGSPIFAVNSGLVYKVNYDSSQSSGLSITIDHGNGYVTQYMHLSKILVSQGQVIERGQRVGLMGNTGASTGTHLHLGVWRGRPYEGGIPLDPCASIFSC